mmetsp:Transcript_11831/g.18975  ORF Transcript_11831/g.18975 Transcript_11831/m.18975 type:complete len:154 (-) Transcript_11831:1480-1941(-)
MQTQQNIVQNHFKSQNDERQNFMNFDFNVGMADLTEVRPRCSRSMDFVALHKKQLNHNESDKIVAQRTKERANLKRSIGAQVAQMMSWGDEILAHSSAPPSKKSCLKTRNDGKDEKQVRIVYSSSLNTFQRFEFLSPPIKRASSTSTKTKMTQ